MKLKHKHSRKAGLPPGTLVRVFAILTVTSTCGSLLFNFTTNGNGELLRERFAAITTDPATLGALLSAIYAIAAFTQLWVGRMIDRVELRRLFLAIVALQIPVFALAAYANGWALFFAAILFQALIFGAIPFTDAIIVRYVDDRMRSRVAGVRFAVAFGISAAAVWALGPIVKANGFDFLLGLSAAIAAIAAIGIAVLPPSAPPRRATSG